VKTGDLVKMKYIMFWAAKNNPHINYTDAVGLVVTGSDRPNNPYAVISVLIGGKMLRRMASEWELVSEKG
jgi:hypothetical protein